VVFLRFDVDSLLEEPCWPVEAAVDVDVVVVLVV
jgi:uncharacterized membrane protein (DUF2068 family)